MDIKNIENKYNKLREDYKGVDKITIAPETFPEIMIGQTRLFYDAFRSNKKYEVEIELVEWDWIELNITDNKYKDNLGESKKYFFNFDFFGNFKSVYSDFEHDMGYEGGQEAYDSLVDKIDNVQSEFINAVEDFKYFVVNKKKERKI